MPKERDCANCFHRKPVLKEDGTWTAECEKWDCEFQSRENMVEKTEAKQGDLISRKWLTDAIRNRRTYLSYEDVKDVIDLIDNAPTVSDRYDEGYAQGYIDGSTGADWKGGADMRGGKE